MGDYLYKRDELLKRKVFFDLDQLGQIVPSGKITPVLGIYKRKRANALN